MNDYEATQLTGAIEALTRHLPPYPLRDLFAAAALAGLAANSSLDMEPTQSAEWAYDQADAMLAARAQENSDV